MSVRRGRKRRPRERRSRGAGGISPPSRSKDEGKPYEYTERDVEKLRRIHETRSRAARRTDESLAAPIAPTPERWIKLPDRYDVPGVDYPDKRIRGAMERRSEAAQRTDRALLAPLASTEEQWMSHPDKYDWPEVDTPQTTSKAGSVETVKKTYGKAPNPMATPVSAKKYISSIVEAYRRKLGVKQPLRLSTRNAGPPARIRHYYTGDEQPRIEVNYGHFAYTWDKDPDLAKRYIEYGVAHELAHEKQFEELGPEGYRRLRKAAKAEAEQDADDRALKAIGVSEETLERQMRKLAEETGGTYFKAHPGYKGTPNIGRFKEEEKQAKPADKVERLKVLYGKALGGVIPTATGDELKQITEKAIAEKWIKPGDDAETAKQRIKQNAEAELVQIRQERARKQREEQLKRLKELHEKAESGKTGEQRIGNSLSLLREDYGAQYEAALGAAISDEAEAKRDAMQKRLRDMGYTEEEAASISGTFNEEAVKRIEEEALKKARSESMALAKDAYGETTELWEEAVRKNRAAEIARRDAEAAVDAAYEEGLKSIRNRAEQAKPNVKPHIGEAETYDFYSDPGHGWLRVPVEKLKELGIEDEISSYSYVKGRYAYLEEDRDAFIFTRTMESMGREVKFRDHNTDNRSAIRGYEPYVKPKDETQQAEHPTSPTEEARRRYDETMADRIPRMTSTWRLNLRKSLLDQGFSAEDADTISGKLTAEDVLGNQGGFISDRRIGEEVYVRPETQAERDALAAVQNEYERLKEEALKKKPTPEHTIREKPGQTDEPTYNSETGMYEVKTYDSTTGETTSKQFSTPDRAKKHIKFIKDNPGWPAESFKERQGNSQGRPKYLITAENIRTRGSEAVRYTVYDRDKSERGGRNVVSQGTVEYKKVPGREQLVRDLIREAPEGPSHEVDFTVTPNWSPTLSRVERIAPSYPGDSGGRWTVWFTNRADRDAEPGEGVGSRGFDNYEEAVKFASLGDGEYTQRTGKREALWAPVPEPPKLPEDLREEFTGEKDRFKVDPEPRYEGTWNQERRDMEYRWAFKNTVGAGDTYTLDQLSDQKVRGEWRKRDREEAAKHSRSITRPKGSLRKTWDREATPLTEAVVFSNMGVMKIHGDKVTVEGMDPSHVALMKLVVPNALSIPNGDYEVADTSIDPRVTWHRHPETVKWDNVDRVLSVSNGSQESTVRYERVNELSNQLPTPKIAFKVKAKLELEALRKAAEAKGVEHVVLKARRSGEAFGDAVIYEATRNEVKTVTHGEGDEAWTSEEDVATLVNGVIGEATRVDEEEVTATYSTAYLSDALNALIKAGFRDATLEYSTDMPLKVSSKRGDGAEAEFYLAPMIGV